MNQNWKKIKDMGPLEYYLHEDQYNDGEYNSGILEEAKIIPPILDDEILNIVKNNWLHLKDPDREIYAYDDSCATKDTYDDENIISRYNPLLCFCNYYSQEVHKFIVFIKKLVWKETQSEGCGGIAWTDNEYECEIYLARELDNIIEYALTPGENYMFVRS